MARWEFKSKQGLNNPEPSSEISYLRNKEFQPLFLVANLLLTNQFLIRFKHCIIYTDKKNTDMGVYLLIPNKLRLGP